MTFYFEGVIEYYDILSFGILTEPTTVNECYAKDTLVFLCSSRLYLFMFYFLSFVNI